MTRTKTGIRRRAKLWPETVDALAAAIECRPQTNDPSLDELVFVTKYGKSWYKDTTDNPVSKQFKKLLDACGLYRVGRTFYALRHTFETIAGESRDQVAVDHVMGHARTDMASLYRGSISDQRLCAVSEHVRTWLQIGQVAYERAYDTSRTS